MRQFQANTSKHKHSKLKNERKVIWSEETGHHTSSQVRIQLQLLIQTILTPQPPTPKLQAQYDMCQLGEKPVVVVDFRSYG